MRRINCWLVGQSLGWAAGSPCAALFSALGAPAPSATPDLHGADGAAWVILKASSVGDLTRAMAREQTRSMQEEYEEDDGYYAD